MRKRIIALVILLCVVLGGLALVASAAFDAEISRLEQQFAEERLDTLREAAHAIEDDLADLVEDIRLARLLVGDRDGSAERADNLGAILRATRGYRMAVTDREGEALVRVESWNGTDPIEGLDAPIRALAAEARRRGPGHLTTSVLDAPDSDRQLVLFAMADEAPRSDAFVLVVEGERLFRKLQIVAAAPSAELLLLNPRGQVATMSSARAAAAWQQAVQSPGASSAMATMVDRVANERTGDLTIPKAQTQGLGLARADVLATWVTIDVEDGRAWRLATFNSTADLRDHERAAGLRVGLVAGALGLILAGFGLVLLRNVRRSAVMEERVRQATLLSHLAEKAQKIVDNVPAGVVTVGDGQFITAVNASLSHLHGEGWVGQPLGEAMRAALGQEEAEPLAEIIRGALTRGTHMTRRAVPTRLFEEGGLCNLHVVPLDPGSADARALVVFEDISSLRTLEDQLLRSEKLATVGVLAAGIAHEIGTPLGVVRGRAEYLLRKLGDDHPHARNLAVIIEQIDRISRTIRELLDFSRPKAASVVAVDLGALGRKALELVQFRAESSRVALRMEVDEAVPAVAADPDQLEQLLVNLLINAIDACETGGEVVLVAVHDADATPASVCIEVQDNGMGIPEEHRHRVFDPFFSTKKQGQGTGLGLSIVAKLARAHDAHVTLDSEPGRGTRVLMQWPAWPHREERHEPS